MRVYQHNIQTSGQSGAGSPVKGHGNAPVSIDGHTKIFALLGHPVGHSFSPRIQNPQFAAHNINGVYLAFDVPPAQLGEAVCGLYALGAQGGNVTVPHKEAVMAHLAEVSEEASLMGAVNTLVRIPGGFRGENTDGRGFLLSLWENRGFVPAGKKVVVLGAGGSARAVAVALARGGAAEIILANRTLPKAQEIADLLNARTQAKGQALPMDPADPASMEDLHQAIAQADLIVHTTTIGMTPNNNSKPELDYSRFRAGQLVTDLIYNPEETAFLRAARLQGADTLNGAGMLYYQAALAFRLWTGKDFLPLPEGDK